MPDLPGENWPSMDRYARGLLRQLAALERDYVLATPPLNGPNGHRRVSGAQRYWDRLVAYPASLRAYRPNVVHVLDHTYAHVVSALPARRSLVTVHDLWPLRRPRRDGSVRQVFLDALTRRTVDGMRAATLLCADSAFSAREVQELLGVAPEQVRVVPLGVEQEFFTPEPAAEVRAFAQDVFDGAGLRLLHVGSCDPRKNIDGLLRIVAEIRRRAPGARLLQVGGCFGAPQRRLMASLRLNGAVVQRARLAETALRCAYRAADVLLLPSVYEGFGLPVLEAQASGLPVLCSDRGSLPEVAGEGAVRLDPHRADDWAVETLEVIEGAAARCRLTDRGYQNARQYTWSRTASQVAAIYAELLDA